MKTIEEKAKAYDKVREKIAVRFGTNVAKEIFTDLYESEDEKIRKWIINEIKIKHHNLDEDNVDFVDKAIAWLENIPYTINHEKREGFHLGYKAALEKQGESYTKKDVDDAYVEGMAFAKNELEKQGEQKPVWHNEDEEPQKDSLILLIMQSGTPIVAKIIEPNHTFNHGERWAYIDDLLEKQGEQKPADKVSKDLKKQ